MKKLTSLFLLVLFAGTMVSQTSKQSVVKGTFEATLETSFEPTLNKILEQNRQILQKVNSVSVQNSILIDETMRRKDPNSYQVRIDYRTPEIFLGSDSTGRDIHFKFQYNGGYGFNIIISDTVTGISFDDGWYNIWIEPNNWWIEKYLNKEEQQQLLSYEFEFLTSQNDIQKEGQFWNMFILIKKGISRAKIDLLSGQSELEKMVSSWNNFE